VLLRGEGVDLVWVGGSEWVTPPMGSPALYDALVQEQERAIVRYVHAHSDAVVQVHCHGKVRRALAKTIERAVDYTEPVEPPPDGDITMREAKALAAGRITLGGNIEQRLMCNESERTVERAVRAAFEAPNDRFVLVTTAGCSPTLAGREFRNYLRLIDLWETLSPL
jgi:uroporphyrinogen-III decarboxylase